MQLRLHHKKVLSHPRKNSTVTKQNQVPSPWIRKTGSLGSRRQAGSAAQSVSPSGGNCELWEKVSSPHVGATHTGTTLTSSDDG
ncbi:MAG: hypothetical protein BJ554DRAFT_1615 [Olpidium bornovanus]|uniref:Uncharacterized protein n=1 Tax=Olpidium bornovanus TaxID=278681 RepID=A0A8H7ZS54_9FUNG|nr:MAG: hypothetical protein BJ554DRAFT_1615 [Olpidium bornovanus]